MSSLGTNFTNLSVYGIPVLPAGMYFDRVLWVSSIYGGNANDGMSPDRPLATIGGPSGAWAKAVTGASGRNTAHGTLVICMKGHAENISVADYGSDLGSNKRVYTVGQGEGVERPTLSWTLAAATLLMDQDNITIDNMNLNLDTGTLGLTVAAPLTISGNGCTLRRVKVRAGTDASNNVTVGITVTGNDCFLDDVFIYGITAAEATTFIRFTGAGRSKVRNLYIEGATSAVGVGCVQFLTTASTFIDWDGFYVCNRKAASTAAVTGMAGVTGRVRQGLLVVLAGTSTELTGAWGTKASCQFEEVKVNNSAGVVGAGLLPIAA